MISLFFALSMILNPVSIEQNANFVRLIEEHELQAIKRNYYRYGNKMKEIAYRRALEIKMNTLPLDKKVDAYINLIKSNAASIDDNFKESNYFSLPISVQKELVKYYISDNDESSLSTAAREYVEKENNSSKRKIKQH